MLNHALVFFFLLSVWRMACDINVKADGWSDKNALKCQDWLLIIK